MKLIIEDDDGRKTVVPFVRDEISIGRDPGNTIRLTEKNVSRRHALLIRGVGHILVDDLSSYNGISLNGERLEERGKVQEGDLVAIGDYNLAIQLDAADLAEMARLESPSSSTGQGDSPSVRVGDGLAELGRGSKAAEATAVIKVDLEALNRSDEGRQLPPEERPRLVALSTNLAGTSFEVPGTVATVGRTETNEIPIDHRSLSREHCKLFLDDEDNWKVLDLGSANGVRVNGEDYGLIHLRSGDILELGHLRLRFCGPGDDFAYDEGALVGSSASPLARLKEPKVLGTIAGVAAITIIVGMLVSGSSAEEDAPAQQMATTTAPLPATSSDETLREAIQAGGDAAEAEDWTEAVAAYQRALEMDPSSATAKQGLSRVTIEADARRIYENALAALDGERWEDALRLFDEIPEQSLYRARSSERRARAFQSHVEGLVTEARQALDREQWSQSISRASAALALAPDHRPAEELKRQGEQGLERAERERQAANARAARERELALAAAQPASAREPGPSEPARTSSPPSSPQTERAPDAPEPAPQAPDPRARAREAFDKGLGHVQRNEFAEAIPHLERAVELDPGGHSRAHALLGTSYARLGNPQRAAMHYRRFLETNPNHQQAAQVRRILEDFERQYQ